MPLRQKIALIVGTVVLAMIGLIAAVLLPVAESFQSLEDLQAERNAGRVRQAILNQLDHMARSAMDWSHWDETYRFVAGEQPDYVVDNLAATSLATLGVNLMQFYNRDGRLVWGGAFDLETGEELDLAEFAPGVLAPDGVLLSVSARHSTSRGIMLTALGPLLVVSSPIVPTEDGAPANGVMVLGRLLDAVTVEALRRQVGVEFEVVTNPSAGAVSAAAAFEVLAREADALVSRQALADLDGRATVELITRTPREITGVGDRALGVSLLSLVVVGLVVVILIGFLLQRLVLRPLTGVTENILRISETGEMDRRLPVQSRDECGVLASEFNRMLERLADARRQLVEQSHRAGMAEMAAGVLHNLRNGLTPLVGGLEELSQRLREAPGSEIGRAVAEVGDPATSPERREKLMQYLCAAGTSLVRRNGEAAAEIERAMAQARTLGEILKFQDRFIYSTSTLGSVALGDVVRDAVALVPSRLCAGAAIELDPSLDESAHVTAERIALVQVIHNLLVNALESIRSSGRGNGRIRISAAPAAGRPDMVDLQVADNGAGIAPADLPRLFERGFTTKPAGAGGLGLHWSANAVGNMRGRLQAYSIPGEGAALHVLLPALDQRRAAA